MAFVPLRRLSVALFVILLASAPQRLSAQSTTGTIAGRIVASESDSSLAGVYVVLPALNLAVQTDARGRFEIRGLPAGRHSLLARAVGRTAARAEVTVVAGDVATLALALRTAVIEVADVTVSASRDAQSLATMPLAIGVIDVSDIAATRAHHPSELVIRTPGAWVSNLGGEGHSTAIRQPITAKAVYQYLEDGVPIRSTGFFNHNGLYEINLPQSGRIEIIKGPGSAVYGSDAIGGAVNSYTREPSIGRSAEFSVEGGSAGYRRGMGTVSNTWGRNGFRADLNITDADGWRIRAPYSRQSGTFRWDVALGQNSRLKTVIAASHIDQPSDGGSDLSRADFDSAATRNYSPITYREVKALRWSTEYAGQTGLTSYGATAYARYNSLDIMPSWQLSFDPQIWASENRSFGLMVRGRRALVGLKTSVSAGIDAEVSPGSRFEQRIIPVQTAGVYTDYTLADVQYDYDVTFWQGAPYIQLAMNPLPGLSLDLGARYDRLGYNYDTHLAVEDTAGHRIPASTDVEFSRLTPKVGASYEFVPGVNLFASYRGGFRVPSESQLFRQGAALNTVDLRPVRAENIETGIKVRLGSVAAFEATAYQMRLHDDVLTFFDPGTGLRTAQNAGETRHRGLETGIDVAPVHSIRLNATATWSKHTYVEWRPRADQDLSGNEMELAPEFFGAFRLSWEPSALEHSSITAEWVKLGKYWQDPQNTHTYPGHDVVSVYATVPVTRGLELVARMTNLFDERFAETSSYTTAQGERLRPGQSRAFFLSGVYRLGSAQ
jgi:iron complex outermembrane recepter protein